jgi:hypothetical protein
MVALLSSLKTNFIGETDFTSGEALGFVEKLYERAGRFNDFVKYPFLNGFIILFLRDIMKISKLNSSKSEEAFLGMNKNQEYDASSQLYSLF